MECPEYPCELNKVSGIAGVANIPEIQAQSELTDKILHTDYLETAGSANLNISGSACGIWSNIFLKNGRATALTYPYGWGSGR